MKRRGRAGRQPRPPPRATLPPGRGLVTPAVIVLIAGAAIGLPRFVSHFLSLFLLGPGADLFALTQDGPAAARRRGAARAVFEVLVVPVVEQVVERQIEVIGTPPCVSHRSWHRSPPPAPLG